MKKNLFIFLAVLTLNNATKAPSAGDCLRLGLRASENFTVSAVACSTAANLFKKDTTTKNLLFNLVLSGLGAELCIPVLWEESGKATNKKVLYQTLVALLYAGLQNGTHSYSALKGLFVGDSTPFRIFSEQFLRLAMPIILANNKNIQERFHGVDVVGTLRLTLQKIQADAGCKRKAPAKKDS